MAILRNVEVWWVKLDPKHPTKPMIATNDDGTPKVPQWEIQIRTTSKEQKNEWAATNVIAKAYREDKNDEESKILYYKTNLSRKSIKREPGKPYVPNDPVQVVNGKNEPLDPNSIGNGSICNIRIYQRDYEINGIKKIANTLMAIQVIKHIVYVGAPMEDFDEAETETILPSNEEPTEEPMKLPDSAF